MLYSDCSDDFDRFSILMYFVFFLSNAFSCFILRRSFCQFVFWQMVPVSSTHPLRFCMSCLSLVALVRWQVLTKETQTQAVIVE